MDIILKLKLKGILFAIFQDNSLNLYLITIGGHMTKYKTIIPLVKELFATTYTLYLKTQNFHWNVVGSDFFELHLLFEKQYNEMQEAIDVIAEHIRTMDTFTPSSFKEFLELSKIDESMGNTPPDAHKMIEILYKDNQTVCQLADALIKETGEEKAGDMATQDLMIDRLRAHRANAWMLKSSL